jgi:hypothetical protein
MSFQNTRLFRYIVLICLIIIPAACTPTNNIPNTQQPPQEIPASAVVPTGNVSPSIATLPKPAPPTNTQSVTATIISETPTSRPSLSASTIATETSAPRVGPTLAFLKDGDIWLLDEPGGEPYPLSVTGDIISYTWAPGGQRLAAFNGKTLCFINRDGSVRTACLDLGLNDAQSKVERQIILSSDQRWVILWNPVNPQDEQAIGWMIVALDTSNDMYRINDPVDWGAALDLQKGPGGFTGQPLFLSDNRLIGTLTHQSLCGSGGCHYRLFQFDLTNKSFSPYPDKPVEGFSEGARLFLSQDSSTLANFGTFITDCSNYATDITMFDLDGKNSKSYNFEKEALIDFSFSPGMEQAILARSSCNNSGQNKWASTCGLYQGFDVLPMQLWTIASNERRDLVPGIMPVWSPGNKWTAFQSCLVEDKNKTWQPTGDAKVSIYLLDPIAGTVSLVTDGTSPQWQPMP